MNRASSTMSAILVGFRSFPTGVHAQRGIGQVAGVRVTVDRKSIDLQIAKRTKSAQSSLPDSG